MDTSAPIVVKKIKKGGHAHHGGAWKVAYADFVTAMMAFFLLLWLLSVATPLELNAISQYFQNPSAIQGEGGVSTSMIQMGGTTDPNQGQADTHELTTVEPRPNQNISEERAQQIAEEADKRRLESLMEELKQAIEQSRALQPFKDQLLLDITSEGLRIQIVDKENRPMFALGSAQLFDYTKEILHQLADVINNVPNRVSISGHTDATPYSAGRDYTNWELSADRANASRRELLVGGLPATKVGRVVGLADSVLFNKASPRDPVNRRISIIVLNKKTEDAMMQESQHAGDIPGTTASSAAPVEASPVAMPDAPAPAPAPPVKAVVPPLAPTPTPAVPKPSAAATPESAVKPSIPVTKPSVPEDKPSVPEDKPSVAEDKPSAPVAEIPAKKQAVAPPVAAEPEGKKDEQSVIADPIKIPEPIQPIQLPAITP